MTSKPWREFTMADAVGAKTRRRRTVTGKKSKKIFDGREKSGTVLTVESKRNMQNEHYNIVINAPRTEAVMTDKFRDGNDLPCLCRTLESELNEALFQIEQLKSIITEMVRAGDDMAQYIPTLEEGNLLKKWLNSKKDLNEYLKHNKLNP